MKISSLSKEQKIISLLLLLPLLTVDKTLNNDIWFILKCGRYVTQNGFPYTEPFTIHQGLSFVMQQWLTGVIFWEGYSTAGVLGLKFIVIMIYILIIFLMFKICMNLSKGNFIVSFAITLFSGILISPFITERPYIFMFLIIILELYFLEAYISAKKYVYLLALPVLSVMLVNLEAAIWPMLFVIMLPYFIDGFKIDLKFVKSEGYGYKHLSIAGVGMLAAGLINPYGFAAMTYLFRSYGVDEINNWITEMHCADINTPFGKVIFFTFFFYILIFIVYRNKNFKIRFCLLALGTAYLALSALRSYPLFIICGIIPLSDFLKDIEIKKYRGKNDIKTLFIRKVLIIFLIVMLAGICIFKVNEPQRSQFMELSQNADFLEKYNYNGMKLYTGYNYGGYMEFRGFKTYIDGRAEVFLKSNNKKDDILKEYFNLDHGKAYYKDVLDKYNFDYLLVSDDESLYYYLDYDSDYKLIHSSSHYKIYQHIE